MDLQTDERLLAKGDHRKGVNIRVSNSEGSEVGAIENVLGNELVTNTLNLGTNPVTIGADQSVGINRIYWLVKSETGSYFVEYAISSDTTTVILEDTRVGDANVLNLSENNHVERIIIIEDYDQGQTLALWSDGRNPIRCVNIDRAKLYGANNFTSEAISLIKRPPTTMPSIVLEQTNDGTENNLEEKFIRFAYAYKYLDGEYSALSSFTPIAFNGKPFQYDFSINSNESMINAFNKVVITVNTGNELVTGIRLVFKESNSNTPYVIDTYDKEEEGWSDNQEVEIDFINNKRTSVLPQDELFRIYDAVPKLANTLETIDNTIAVSDYTENYNLIDVNDNPVNIDMSLVAIDSVITGSVATQSVKTIRDYEVGVVYLDEDKRMTSVLTSKNNTVNIPGIKSNLGNRLQLSLNHLAPSFATHYRIFIKQSKYEYNTLVPTLFYNDGVFVWIKLESGEQDKIKEGDYLIVKADTTGLISDYRETRVIEITTKEKNFLEDDPDAAGPTKQLAGRYFKIKPDSFRINEEDFEYFEFAGYDNTRPAYSNPVRGLINVIEPAVYYGTNGLNDLTESGSYTGTSDVRYIVEIEATGTPDTFKWSDDDGTTFSTSTAIVAGAQVLNNGVSIEFGSTTGHAADDSWIISAKNASDDGLGTNENDFTYALFKSIPSNTNVNVDDVIEGGARITLNYREYDEGNTSINKNYISSRRYANIEEWWFGDNIADDFNYPEPSRIWFRRGTTGKDGNADFFQQDPTGDMVIILKSIADETGGDSKVKASTFISITQSDQNILLETKSTPINDDIFFEIGDTYTISPEGYHLGLTGNDTNQTVSNSATIILNFWNCISWGNGFESYKIKDAFNATSLNIDTRPNTFIDDYRENYRRSGITLSGRYEQTTNYNAINEFNYSLGNFIDLDDSNGAIKYLYARDNKTLIAFQENRVTPLGYKKTFIYDQEGVATFIQSDDILTIPESYAGEHGLSDNPESIAFFGNRAYFTDRRRGAPMRLSTDGMSEINILTKDFFKDLFRNYPNAKYEGGYDPYFDEYLLVVTDNNVQFTMGFAENGYSDDKKGWTSFYQFVPEKIIGINNRLYTFKNGQLWLHNSENVPRMNFYGVQYTAKVTTILNDDPLNDKIYKTLVTSSNSPWSVTLKTNLTTGTLSASEFNRKESRYYAYLRQNEDITNLKGNAVQGVGNLQSFNGNILSFNSVSEVISIGNSLYQVVLGQKQLIGEIENFTSTTITVVSIQNTPVPSSFCFSLKDTRIEGGNIRGYYLEVTLENTDTEFAELFAVESNIVQSDLQSR